MSRHPAALNNQPSMAETVKLAVVLTSMFWCTILLIAIGLWGSDVARIRALRAQCQFNDHVAQVPKAEKGHQHRPENVLNFHPFPLEA